MVEDGGSRSIICVCCGQQEMLARKGLFGVKGTSIFVFVRFGAFLKGRDFDGRIAPQN